MPETYEEGPMQSMSSAPRDGTPVLVLGPKGWRRARYIDCEWLRNDCQVIPGGRVIPGDPDIADCWRPDAYHEGDIELNEARGWKPAAAQ